MIVRHAEQFENILVFLESRLAGEKALAGARPVCRTESLLSPCPDPCCSLFIPAPLNEFITPWGSALPKCNVLPPLCAWRASIESTFIILTFRYPQRGAPFALLPADFLCFPAECGLLRLFLLRLFEVLFHEAEKKSELRGEYWMKIKIN